jgi:hypothetical protein
VTWVAAGLAAVTVLVSAAPRLMLASGALPDEARPFIWSDVIFTYARSLPYWDRFFDYPPGIGYPAAAFVLISGDPVAYTALWTVVTVIGAAAVAVMLARAVGATRAIWYWSLSPQLLLLGALNFDVVPVALMVGAVLLARRGRPYLTSVTLAIGAVTKVFPAALFPLELVRLWRERGPRAALVALGLFTSAALLIVWPSLTAPFPSTLSFLNAASRTNFDSIWGIAAAGLAGVGVPEAARWIGFLTLVGLMETYFRRAMPAARAAGDPARAALFALIAVLFWSRLYSPQFSLWLLPLFALAGVSARTYALLSLADVLVFTTVYPLTLVAWGTDDLAPVLLLGALALGVVLRHAALVVAWRDTSQPVAPA